MGTVSTSRRQFPDPEGQFRRRTDGHVFRAAQFRHDPFGVVHPVE